MDIDEKLQEIGWLGSYNSTGSTATVLLLTPQDLYVANLGDSRTVMSVAGKTQELSTDHKPENEQERKRIEATRRKVEYGGIVGKHTSLRVSRAFGDFLFKDDGRPAEKQAVCPIPEITKTPRQPD